MVDQPKVETDPQQLKDRVFRVEKQVKEWVNDHPQYLNCAEMVRFHQLRRNARRLGDVRRLILSEVSELEASAEKLLTLSPESR